MSHNRILCPRLGAEWIGRISWLPRAPLGPIFMTGLRPKHRAYYRSGRPVIKIGPNGALGSHGIRPIHSAPSLGQSIACWTWEWRQVGIKYNHKYIQTMNGIHVICDGFYVISRGYVELLFTSIMQCMDAYNYNLWSFFVQVLWIIHIVTGTCQSITNEWMNDWMKRPNN